jgi:hypothetical protein
MRLYITLPPVSYAEFDCQLGKAAIAPDPCRLRPGIKGRQAQSIARPTQIIDKIGAADPNAERWLPIVILGLAVAPLKLSLCDLSNRINVMPDEGDKLLRSRRQSNPGQISDRKAIDANIYDDTILVSPQRDVPLVL